MTIAALVVVLVLWDMPQPPPCERVRWATIDVYGLTLDDAAVKAQEKAAKKRADTVWVKEWTEPGPCGGWYRIKGLALRCEQQRQ